MANLKSNITEKLDLSWADKFNVMTGKISIKDLPNYNTAIKESLAELSNDLKATAPDERYGLLREELSSVEGDIDGMGGLISSIDKAGPDVQNALSNAVAYNPSFSTYIMEKVDGGGQITEGLKDIDPQARGPVADILNKIAEDGRDGKNYDFEKLDNVLESTSQYAATQKTLTDTKQMRDDLLKEDPNANTIALDSQIENLGQNAKKQKGDLIADVQAAGGNLPAFANLDVDMIFQFVGDIFDPNVGPQGAVKNLMNNLKLDPASEQGQAMAKYAGYGAKYLEFQGGKLEDKSYAYVINKYKDDVMPKAKSIAKEFKTIAGERRVFDEPKASNDQTFSKPTGDKTDITNISETAFNPNASEQEQAAPERNVAAHDPRVLSPAGIAP